MEIIIRDMQEGQRINDAMARSEWDVVREILATLQARQDRIAGVVAGHFGRQEMR